MDSKEKPRTLDFGRKRLKQDSFVLVRPDSKSTTPLNVSKGLKSRRMTRRSGGGKRKVPSLPPDLDWDGTMVLRTRLRFEATATVTQAAITDYNVIAALGGIYTTTTVLTCFCSAFRLRRITIWPSSGGEGTTEWAFSSGDLFSMPDVVHDSSLPVGITVSKPESSVPPKNSPANGWHVPSTSTGHILCTVTATNGSVVDVELDFTTCANIAPLAVTEIASTVGVLGYARLDGVGGHLRALGRPALA